MGIRSELLIRLILSIPISLILGLWGIWFGLCILAQAIKILIHGKRSKFLHQQIDNYFEFYIKCHRYLWLLSDKRPF